MINIILKQTQFNHIKLESYSNNSLDTTIFFIINNITIKILTDFNNYCIGETTDENKIKLFNINIIFLEKTPLNIISELNDIFKNIIVNNESEQDLFNFNNAIKVIIKHEIDYDILKTNLLKYYDKNLLINILSNQDIIFNKKELVNITINELRNFNKNIKYKHYITINYDEPNIFIVRYIFNDTLKQKINNYFGYEYVEIKLNIKYYPYFPPKIEYSKPQINNDLLIAILDIDILKLSNWNNIISIEYLLINLGEELEKIIDDNIIYDLNIDKINYDLIQLAYIFKYTNNKIKINIDYIYENLSKNIISITNKNSGIGYGGEINSSKWNIKDYIKEQEIINNNIQNHLLNINSSLNSDNINILIESFFIEYVNDTIKQLTMLELEKNKDIYIILFDIIEKILNNNNNQNKYFINITNLYNEISIIENINSIELAYMRKIIEISKIINKSYDIINNTNDIITDQELYINTMKNLQYDFYEINDSHLFYNMINNKPNKKALSRILTELGSFKTSLPLNWNSTIWIRISKNNFNLFSFIISGPENTPYENGLFEFHAYFSDDYPNTIPQVLLNTTGKNSVRFNPNLYNNGKVCLSLLGTWSGQDSEKWIPETSTFIQIIISIQSLILIDDPYFNEPGYEKYINTTEGKEKSLMYNLNIYPNTIKYAMIEMLLNPPLGFEIVIKEHFKYKKNDIIKKLNEWELLYKSKNNEFIHNKEKLINMLI